MDIFEQFATDTTKEEDGVWFPLDDDTSLLIARSGNKKYSRMITKAFELNKRLLDLKNDAAEKKSEEILIDTLAKTVLIGWKGVKFQKEELPYSIDNAKKLLAVKQFRRLVQEYADDTEAFRLQTSEEDEGNS